MSSSYQKLKKENNKLKIQIAVLEDELGTVIICPDSYEAAEIRARVIFKKDTMVLVDMQTRKDRNPPYPTGGIIPYIINPHKIIIK